MKTDKKTRSESTKCGYRSASTATAVDKIIEKVRKKNKVELEMGLIRPIHPDYPFSTNGLYLFVGRQGSGKSHQIVKHILICERILSEPLYGLIIFCSTSGALDKTISTMLPQIKTPLVVVPDNMLIPFMKKHILRKEKFYSFIKYIKSNFKECDKRLNKCIDKHNLRSYDKKTNTNPKLLMYIVNKLADYNISSYPYNTLLILDDFAGHEMINRPDRPLCKLLTKCRHYNLTAIIAVQTTKFIIKNLKRMVSDVVLYKGVSYDDYHDLMRELPHSFDDMEVWVKYKELESPHSKLIMNLTNNSYEIEL